MRPSSPSAQKPGAPEIAEEGPVPQYPIESVDNALRVLLLFNEQRRVRLTDVAAYLSVATSTAHRLLAALAYRGFVRQDLRTRSYEPGPALTAISAAVVRNTDIQGRARPAMEQLALSLRETVHLGRLEGSTVWFLDSVEGERAVRVSSRMGRAVPAHCTSTGKALLASLDTDSLRSLFPEEQLAPMTEHSITSRERLLRELDETRARGAAISREESEEGVASVAVFLGQLGAWRYALNVSAPVYRMTRTLEKRALDELHDMVREIGVEA